MPKVKQDKYDVLASVIDSIYDINKRVVVETIDAGMPGNESAIPTKAGKTRLMGSYSENGWYAKSIKIGNVSMKYISVKKGSTQEYKYIVRTPDGEAEFSTKDRDFLCVWHSALRRYDIDNGAAKGANQNMSDVKSYLYEHVRHNKKLANAAGKGITIKDNKSKYETAIELLKHMGVQPKRLAAYIEKKSQQNA